MENASKALLIAGAILICILLIAIGMYIYNSANATIKSAASSMSQQEKDIYNSKLDPYEGENIKGSEVVSLINTIISKNQENAGQTGKFISIAVTAKKGTLAANTECNFYTGNGNNTEEEVKSATTEMTSIKSAINTSKRYTVSFEREEGIIYLATITENGYTPPASPATP